MIGYTIGLITCIIFLFAFNIGQPALLYLSPGTLIPTMIYAKMNGKMKEFWNGELDDRINE